MSLGDTDTYIFLFAASEEEFKKKEAQMLELQEVYETRLLQLKVSEMIQYGDHSTSLYKGLFERAQ